MKLYIVKRGIMPYSGKAIFEELTPELAQRIAKFNGNLSVDCVNWGLTTGHTIYTNFYGYQRVQLNLEHYSQWLILKNQPAAYSPEAEVAI